MTMMGDGSRGPPVIHALAGRPFNKEGRERERAEDEDEEKEGIP